jgi:LysM repeat protein
MRTFRPVVLALGLLLLAAAQAPLGHAAGLRSPVAQKTHCIKQGETLYRIALLYGVTTQAIAAANGIVNPNLIYAGQCLTIPAATPGATAVPGVPASGPCSAPNSPLLKSSNFIFATAPNAGAWLKPGFKVSGCSNVFEAQFSWRLKDAGASTIANGHVTASCGTGCVGSFAFNVAYSVGQTQVGTMEVFDEAASDGHEILLNSIPVVLQP